MVSEWSRTGRTIVASLAAVMMLAGCGQNAYETQQGLHEKDDGLQLSENDRSDVFMQTITGRGITYADLTDAAMAEAYGGSTSTIDESCFAGDLALAMKWFNSEDAWQTYCGFVQRDYAQNMMDSVRQKAKEDAQKLNEFKHEYREWSGQNMTWDEFKQAHPGVDPGESTPDSGFDSSSVSNEEYFDYMNDYYSQDSGCNGLARRELGAAAMDAYPDLPKTDALTRYMEANGCRTN